MDTRHCEHCLFCEESNRHLVRCSNADLAMGSVWEDIYLGQGYLELLHKDGDRDRCFWYVPRS